MTRTGTGGGPAVQSAGVIVLPLALTQFIASHAGSNMNGATGAIALSYLPGLPLAPAVAMGLAATCAAMLQLPPTSVLLATLMLGADGLTVMPLVIVAVTVPTSRQPG